MRLRPALVLAAPVGVLGGHAIGYLAAPGPAGAAAVHHGYLALASGIALPLAVAAMGWAAVAGRGPADRHRSVPVGPLLLAQWMLFTGQEVVEHALAGHGPAAALQSPALWFGLAAQVVTAAAAIAVLRASAAAGSRLLALPRPGSPISLARVRWRPAGTARPPSRSVVTSCPSRGPPPARLA
ncbi:MAG: hypothetical protein QOE93_2254 [Actinomycetota bacterium]|jgi:hypothetical protein|nr:hypothetical protein [Actinomycetota bacterium]